jgi:hypothetical protein
MLEKLVNALRTHGADSAVCGHINEYIDGRRAMESAPLPSGVYGSGEIRDAIVRSLLHDRVEGRL